MAATVTARFQVVRTTDDTDRRATHGTMDV